MAAVKHWKVHQLDVKNAFLCGVIQETTYSSQTRGLKNASLPHAVGKLKKALYGLKEAPRAWFDRFNDFQFSQGFKSNVEDPSLFVLNKDDDLVVHLLYVDDMLVTGNSSALFDEFLLQLKKEFAIKDLRQVHHFLGIQIETTKSGLFLSQMRYAQKNLQKANLMDCKPVANSLVSELQVPNSSQLFNDPTLFRCIAGSLQ